jgi:hypothetical protein
VTATLAVTNISEVALIRSQEEHGGTDRSDWSVALDDVILLWGRPVSKSSGAQKHFDVHMMELRESSCPEPSDKASGLIDLRGLGVRVPPTWVVRDGPMAAGGVRVLEVLSSGPVLVRPSIPLKYQPASFSGLIPSVVARDPLELFSALRTIEEASAVIGGQVASSPAIDVLVQPFLEPMIGGVMQVFPEALTAQVAICDGHPAQLLGGAQMPSLEFWITPRQPASRSPGYIVLKRDDLAFAAVPDSLLRELQSCAEAVEAQGGRPVEIEWLFQPPTWFVQIQPLITGFDRVSWAHEE